MNGNCCQLQKDSQRPALNLKNIYEINIVLESGACGGEQLRQPPPLHFPASSFLLPGNLTLQLPCLWLISSIAEPVYPQYLAASKQVAAAVYDGAFGPSSTWHVPSQAWLEKWWEKSSNDLELLTMCSSTQTFQGINELNNELLKYYSLLIDWKIIWV